jgi:hypothetical protein
MERDTERVTSRGGQRREPTQDGWGGNKEDGAKEGAAARMRMGWRKMKLFYQCNNSYALFFLIIMNIKKC